MGAEKPSIAGRLTERRAGSMAPLGYEVVTPPVSNGRVPSWPRSNRALQPPGD